MFAIRYPTGISKTFEGSPHRLFHRVAPVLRCLTNAGLGTFRDIYTLSDSTFYFA